MEEFLAEAAAMALAAEAMAGVEAVMEAVVAVEAEAAAVVEA